MLDKCIGACDDPKEKSDLMIEVSLRKTSIGYAILYPSDFFQTSYRKSNSPSDRFHSSLYIHNKTLSKFREST